MISKKEKPLNLDPKPIDSAELLSELIEYIKDSNHIHREAALNFFIYNVSYQEPQAPLLSKQTF